ncbi:MAG TPA: hypothetical protein VF523_19340, partial [Burkholderiales bacterium]
MNDIILFTLSRKNVKSVILISSTRPPPGDTAGFARKSVPNRFNGRSYCSASALARGVGPKSGLNANVISSCEKNTCAGGDRRKARVEGSSGVLAALAKNGVRRPGSGREIAQHHPGARRALDDAVCIGDEFAV